MPKKQNISPEEQAEFRDAVKAATPLKDSKQLILEQARPKPVRRAQPAFNATEPPYIAFHLEEEMDGDTVLHFHKPGLQDKLLQKMSRGQVSIEAYLDLHGLTIEEATSITHEFITECCQGGKRWICLVHGKGHYSPEGKPILKNWANQWLRNHPQVLAFQSARPKDGGTGALYILLKRKGN